MRLRTPLCPLCEQPPAFTLCGGVQAFCGNMECRVLTWNPSVTLAENLREWHDIDLSDMP